MLRPDVEIDSEGGRADQGVLSREAVLDSLGDHDHIGVAVGPDRVSEALGVPLGVHVEGAREVVHGLIRDPDWGLAGGQDGDRAAEPEEHGDREAEGSGDDGGGLHGRSVARRRARIRRPSGSRITCGGRGRPL